MWKEAKHRFQMENNKRLALQKVRYCPTLKNQGPGAAAMKEAAYVSRRYFQLKSGHTVTGTYLHCKERLRLTVVENSPTMPEWTHSTLCLTVERGLRREGRYEKGARKTARENPG